MQNESSSLHVALRNVMQKRNARSAGENPVVADSCVPARSFSARVWMFSSRIFQRASLSDTAGRDFWAPRKGRVISGIPFEKLAIIKRVV